ncbi:MAG: hypothetical protein PVH07_04325 [Chloroflexota bacterium]|jgi:hypothetical protein
MTTPDEPLVSTASVEEVMSAIEAVDLDAPWEDVAPNLRLALPRRRALPVDIEELPQRHFPPGIDVVLGLDIGPAMLFVAHEQLARWGVSAEAAFERALDNVRLRAAERRQFALVHERIADVPTLAFQSREGWASSLLLLPEELARVFGERTGLILAPMRDLVMCLPLDVEREFAQWLLDEFAEVDMNALDLPPFALVDGHLTHAVGVPPALRRTTAQH